MLELRRFEFANKKNSKSFLFRTLRSDIFEQINVLYSAVLYLKYKGNLTDKQHIMQASITVKTEFV